VPKNKKPSHIFLSIPLEMFYEILSHLNLNDLATLAQVSKWTCDTINNLTLSYQVTMLKRVRRQGHRSKKIIVHKPITSTYVELCEKLNIQVHKERELWNTSVSGMRALGVIVLMACSPVLAGALLDGANIDISNYTLGFSGFDLGGTTSMLLMSCITWQMLSAVYSAKDKIAPYRSVQVVEKDNLNLKIMMR
jgi:hypothetical protein